MTTASATFWLVVLLLLVHVLELLLLGLILRAASGALT